MGDTIQIVYDPEDPTSDVRDVRKAPNHTFAYLSLGITIVGAVAVPLAIWKKRRDDRRRTPAST